MSIRLFAVLRLLRPKQWVKNAFVFAGVLFGAQLHNWELLRSAVLAALAFSLTSSCVYVLNDILDREADRAHPKKRHRPLAAGLVSPIQGAAAGFICLIAGLLSAQAADPRVLVIVLLYLAINAAYSWRLKQVAVVDVFCIASGFMLRIMAGTWGIHIAPSGWLILTGMFLTLFLGFSKRRAEWVAAGGAHARRQVLNRYSQSLLDSFLSISATGTVLCYGLYTLDAQTIAVHHTDKLIYTMPFVLFGLFRYLLIIHDSSKGEDPSADVFTDGQLLLSGAAWSAAAFWLLNR